MATGTQLPFVLSLSKHSVQQAKPSFVARALRQAQGERKQRHQTGFTLIEMMVALAVFSLAALALLRLESATIRGAGILDDTLVAQMVARNVAIDAVTAARAPTLGSVSGVERNGGRDWTWTRNVVPTGDTRIVRIDVTVNDRTGRRAGHLTMVRNGTGT